RGRGFTTCSCLHVNLAFAEFSSRGRDKFRVAKHYYQLSAAMVLCQTKDLVIAKETLHRQYKERPTACNYLRFSNVRALCKLSAKRDYRQHLERVDQGVSVSLRFFWSHVNDIKNSS
ncbi:hypothetical protein J6590_106941, partial [Homalodisca vitripennis]